jgi:alpha-glucosidase
MHKLIRRMSGLVLSCMAAAPVMATPDQPTMQARPGGADIHMDSGTLKLRMVRANVLHVHFLPDGTRTAPTLVMAPDAPGANAHGIDVEHEGDRLVLRSSAVRVTVDPAHDRLSLYRAGDARPLLSQDRLGEMRKARVRLDHARDIALYGIGSFNATEAARSNLLRKGDQLATAGKQGHAGAPLVWSTDGFAVLVDSKGARFDLSHHRIAIDHLSRPDADYYLIVGAPKAIFAAVADLSGHAQLFPKWAMGFSNSQWGTDEKQLLDIIRSYREKRIPIDNFTLDFDWKAWGEDHYGEFRWNPKTFPDGPSGKLARMLAARGVHLTGIMKPRLHVDTVEGRYATAHHFWRKGEKTYDDYFSHKPVKDIDFDSAAARRWFGALSMKYAFDHGIVGWWNDEADDTGDDTQFLNMQRSLYEAQRAQTDLRVWSINRNFWLGSQRYGYGMWSGDIPTSFASMAGQRQRMLASIDVGAMLWGMDTGGYKSHPSNENYARWMQFAAFVPIFRVHGTFNEKRQPWLYGPMAERAATAAIRLRYRLIPYIYAYAWQYHAHGVGLVRPLIFDWPHDPKVRNDVSAWMFGDWLLVSPVVHEGQTHKDIYLPAGTWTDYFSGKTYAGGQTLRIATDAKTWSDIPLFIRQGAIIPSQPLMQFVGQHPVTTVSVDVFPDTRRTHFDYYDDDGTTYAYEHGAYYLQRLSTQRIADGATFTIAPARGSYVPPLQDYLVKMHGTAAGNVDGAGRHFTSLKALEASTDSGWATGRDRYGPVTWMRLKSGQARHVTVHTH